MSGLDPLVPVRIPRFAEAQLRESLGDSRVVLLAGARQVGKSTLARAVLPSLGRVHAFNLDDAATREALLADPTDVTHLPGTVFIDEVQRAPEVLLAVKSAVDRDDRPGQFLLTGSAQVMTLPRVADSLAGRMEIVELGPFSQGEMERRREGFVDWLFSGDPPPRGPLTESRRDYLERAVVGGYPEAVRRDTRRRRSAWFRDYLRAFVQRDVHDLADLGKVDQLPLLLRLVAARVAGLVNVSGLAGEAGMARPTVERYLAVLEQAYLVCRVPAWSPSASGRVVKSPKLYLHDSGLLAYLLGADAEALARPEGGAGPVLESFTLMELRRQACWASVDVDFHHFRTKDGLEVDSVLRCADGRLAGVEVKAAGTVRAGDFRGLRQLREASRGDLIRSVVLYTGEEVRRFPEGWAIPLSAVWRWGTRETQPRG